MFPRVFCFLKSRINENGGKYSSLPAMYILNSRFLLQSLSMNGEVIFYDGAELSFSDTDRDLNACQGK